MKILFVVSEAHPLVKTGGLADVAGALPAALTTLGEEIRVMLPAYPAALAALGGVDEWLSLGDPLGAGEVRLGLGRMPDSGVPVWLVDCPPLYDRPGSPYQDPEGIDWLDNDLRFAALARAAAIVCDAGAFVGWRPDVLHAHDWQTGLAPAYLALRGGQRPATVFTIHNVGFPGIFPADRLSELGLPPESFFTQGVEYYGNISFLKAGIYYSDRITTVSPTYAREVLDPEESGGLGGLLASRGSDLSGILNGIDAATWDPARDPCIARPYTAERLGDKAANKTALQRELGLPEDSGPLLGVVSRLTGPKGLDLILEAMPAILAEKAQLVVLGSGEPKLERKFARAAKAHPLQVAARIGYDEELAHRIQAGADILLVPSRSEPCGLTQLYALRYGTVPVVRRTGGLADTVKNATGSRSGTGFVFSEANADDLLGAVLAAIKAYRKPRAWRMLQRRAMKADFRWDVSARQYQALYLDLVRKSWREGIGR